MTRKEILKGLYEKIGGNNAGWISDFQNLGSQIVGNPQLSGTTENSLDNMADWNYHFRDLEAVIQYEKTIQSLFDNIHERLEKLVEENGNNETIEELQEDLEDLVETIKISYITLNSNYLTYVDRADELFGKIDLP